MGENVKQLESEIKALKAELKRVSEPLKHEIEALQERVDAFYGAILLANAGLRIGDKVYITDEYNDTKRPPNDRLPIKDSRIWEIVRVYHASRYPLTIHGSGYVNISTQDAIDLHREYVARFGEQVGGGGVKGAK